MKIKLNGILLLLVIAGTTRAADTNQVIEQTARLSSISRGSGIIRPDYNGKNLVLGKTYTVVAKADARYIFTNWTDDYETVLTNHPRLTFVMKTNSVIIANFVKREYRGGRLDGISAAQFPLKILAAVNAASAGMQSQVLTDWINEVAGLRPSALPSVVATVVVAHPELLETAVKAAVTAAPAEANGVVFSAAKIPGTKLADVVAVACIASPTSSYQIAQAALDVDPNAGKTILETIAANVPELRSVIDLVPGYDTKLSRNQTLAILSQSLTVIHWPVDPVPANENQHDYSQP